MKTLRTLGWILLVPVIAGAGATAWLLTHEEEIEALVLQAIGSGLQTDAHITELKLTWWATFPKISVTLEEVWLKGSTGAPDDMLLRAEAVHLALDIRQFLQDDFTVEAVRVHNADLHLRAARDGAWNVAVWSAPEASESAEAFSFALQACTFDDVRLTIDNGSSTALQLNDVRCGLALDAKGAWSMDITGNGLCRQIAGLAFPTALPLDIQAAAARTADDNWLIDLNRLASGDLLLKGRWSQATDAPGTFEGTFEGLNASVADVLYPDWNGSGAWDLAHAFSGALAYADNRFVLEGRAPEAAWAWGLLSGRAAAAARVVLASGKWSISLTDGKLSMPGLQATAVVRCPDIAAGEWTIQVAPTVDLARVEGLSALLPEPLTIVAGHLSGQTSATFLTSSDSWSRTTADLSLRALELTSGDLPATVESARVKFSGLGSFSISDLVLNTLGNTFTGEVDGADGEITLDLACRRLDIPTSFPDIGDWGNDGSGQSSMRWTKATLTADKIRWVGLAEGDWALQNSIELTPVDRKTTGNEGGRYALAWRGEVAGGRMHIDGVIDARDPGRWPLRFETTAQGLELQPLFATFRNFDQSTLRAEHLRGQVDWTGDIAMDWDMQAGAIAESVQAEAQLNWRDVRLDNVEALQEIAAYLRENRLMAPLVDPDDLAQRLRRIDITESTTDIAMVNGDFMLDPLTIHSSAMDVDIAGGQTWAGALDYTLGFALRDLKNSREDAFGQIEDDGLGHRFFLTIEGTLDDPEYGWDREAGKEARKARFDEEKQNLRALFRKNRSETKP